MTHLPSVSLICDSSSPTTTTTMGQTTATTKCAACIILICRHEASATTTNSRQSTTDSRQPRTLTANRLTQKPETETGTGVDGTVHEPNQSRKLRRNERIVSVALSLLRSFENIPVFSHSICRFVF